MNKQDRKVYNVAKEEARDLIKTLKASGHDLKDAIALTAKMAADMDQPDKTAAIAVRLVIDQWDQA